jgi:hypothetical protein
MRSGGVGHFLSVNFVVISDEMKSRIGAQCQSRPRIREQADWEFLGMIAAKIRT